MCFLEQKCHLNVNKNVKEENREELVEIAWTDFFYLEHRVFLFGGVSGRLRGCS